MRKAGAETTPEASGTGLRPNALSRQGMSEATGHDLSHLPPAAGRLGAAFARPKVLAAVCVIALTGLGWLALGLLFSGMGAYDALCQSPAMPHGTWGACGFAVVALMWGAMTLAIF